jgi:hypothetical protein
VFSIATSLDRLELVVNQLGIRISGNGQKLPTVIEDGVFAGRLETGQAVTLCRSFSADGTYLALLRFYLIFKCLSLSQEVSKKLLKQRPSSKFIRFFHQLPSPFLLSVP